MRGFQVVIVMIVGLGLLTGCAGKPLEGPSLMQEAITLEQRAIRAAQSQDFTLADNLAAESLDLYTVLDNRDGQTRLLILRTRLALQGGLQKRARRFLRRAQALVRPEDRNAQYELALLAGHLAEDRKAQYEKALAVTEEPLRQAVALTYLGRFAEARELVEKAKPKTRREFDDLGLVLYEHARSSNSEADARQALGYYKVAENILGISDTLFLLGKLASARQDTAIARDYFERALAVNQRLGDEGRIGLTEKALADLAPATATSP